MLWAVVFECKQQHLKPERNWYGWDAAAACSPKLAARLFKLAFPMILQYALDGWASTFMYAFIGTFGQEAVSGYGVGDALTGAGGSFGLAIYTATSGPPPRDSDPQELLLEPKKYLLLYIPMENITQPRIR